MRLKGHCERCGTMLEDGGIAFNGSYECTFCPNCGDERVARPRLSSEQGVVSG